MTILVNILVDSAFSLAVFRRQIMNILNVVGGLAVTAGVYGTVELDKKLSDVNQVEYEMTEDIRKGTSISDAIDIVRRNDKRRRKLAFKLNNVLNRKTEDR